MIQAGDHAKELDFNVLFAHHPKEDIKPQNIIRFVEKALKSQRGLSKLEKEVNDPYRLLANEFNELYLSTLMAYYITIHHINEHLYDKAVLLS